jgi:FKBP-type peptidyl-prolyl cis-trans isomerase FklB
MIKKIVLAIAIVLPVSSFAQNTSNDLKNEIDSVSYGMGMAIGNSMKSAGFTEVNGTILLNAINDVLKDKPTELKVDQIDQIIRSYLTKTQAKKGAENLVIGRKFLEENKKKDGIVTLPSGLQYKILKEGEGTPPTINDTVTVNYVGKLINGKVFDSSIERGQPAQFEVKGVIAGWTEALQLMKPGAKWQLFIPSELAYGEQNVPGIEPQSVLIFEVDLISIDKVKK